MNNIKRIRNQHNMTQAELAKKIGVKSPAVTKWEGGKSNPTLQNLERMATVLTCSTDELLGRCTPNSGKEHIQ